MILVLHLGLWWVLSLFLSDVRSGSNFLLHVQICMWISMCSSTICWKSIFSSVNCLGTLVENQLSLNVFISGVSALPHWSVCLSLMPVTNCLDKCNFVVSCEIWKYEPFKVVYHFFSFSLCCFSLNKSFSTWRHRKSCIFL